MSEGSRSQPLKITFEDHTVFRLTWLCNGKCHAALLRPGNFVDGLSFHVVGSQLVSEYDVRAFLEAGTRER
jgi:hypothetical protein